jgi:hypothetical protein
MLEFIVLGIIPGTKIQLSPFGVMLASIALVLAVRFAVDMSRSYLVLERYEQFIAYYTLTTQA